MGFQESVKGVSGKFLGYFIEYFKEVKRLFQGTIAGILRRFKGVSRIFQGFSKGISWVFRNIKGCLEVALREFQSS